MEMFTGNNLPPPPKRLRGQKRKVKGRRQKKLAFLASAKALSPLLTPCALLDIVNFFFFMYKRLCFLNEKGLKRMILQ